MGIVELIKSAEIFEKIYRKFQLWREKKNLNREIDKIEIEHPLARDIIFFLIEQGTYTRDYWASIAGIRSSLNNKKHRRFGGLIDYDPEFFKALKELNAKKLITLKDDSFRYTELDLNRLSPDGIEQIRKQEVTLNTKHEEIKKIINLRFAS